MKGGVTGSIGKQTRDRASGDDPSFVVGGRVTDALEDSLSEVSYRRSAMSFYLVKFPIGILTLELAVVSVPLKIWAGCPRTTMVTT